MACDSILDGNANNSISRSDGLVLLLIFITFIYYTILVAKKDDKQDRIEAKKADDAGELEVKHTPLWKSLLFIVLGLAGLIIGGNIFVDSASSIAFRMGMSESLVGLTIVAMGTSVPELATSIVAAFKNKAGMAVGNAIGSNIFNILLILGASASITPLKMGNITPIDLLVLLGVSLLVWLFARTSHILSRLEGGIMIIIYLCYIVYLIFAQ